MSLNNLIIVDNSFVKRDLTILRNKNTQPNQFRLALKRVSFSLAIAMSKDLELIEEEVETPLEITKGFKLKKEVILVPVLRAGLSLIEPFLEMIPNANVGHIGLQRDEKTLKPVDYYYKTPKLSDTSVTILLDPMLATGGSASAAFNFLKGRGAKDCILVSLIAAPEGVMKLNKEHPEVPIYTAALDRQLNEVGYILPGLGDAGDRTFGTL